MKQSTGKPYREDELDLPELVQLLSTPNARDWKNEPGKNYNAGGLPREVKDLLPTPRASDGEKGSPNQAGSSGDLMLPSAVQPSRWGKYREAVERWEAILGRDAPPATTPTGRNGNPRLNPALPEWMMGLPAGWVTEVPGLTRREQLHALGNGVCIQQCALAVRLLLDL